MTVDDTDSDSVVMKRTQISLDRETYEAARKEARRQGVSFAEFCRRAIRRALGGRESEKPWMRLAGVLRSGDPGLVRRTRSS